MWKLSGNFCSNPQHKFLEQSSTGIQGGILKGEFLESLREELLEKSLAGSHEEFLEESSGGIPGGILRKNSSKKLKQQILSNPQVEFPEEYSAALSKGILEESSVYNQVYNYIAT